MVQALAHECAHSLLFGLSTDGPLVQNDEGERFASPLRSDPRPIDGILHATFVTARMHQAVARLLEAEALPGSDRAEAERALATNAELFARGLATLDQHARLTPIGAAALAGARRLHGARRAMRHRVIQWATGGVGRAAIEGILDHPELELVGCWVHSADKHGRDVGEILGRAPIGVRATRDADALLALPADCVLYSPLVGIPAEVARILASGKNVVTPLGWFYPFVSQDTTEIEAACGRAASRCTDRHPTGGITERLPLVISSLSRAITHVRAEDGLTSAATARRRSSRR